MITGTYKNVKPIDCSRTDQKKQLFLIDHFGYINSFLIDDFDVMLRTLKLSPALLPLASDLIHANIVFGFSEKIGLKPGLFLDGDKAIIENLKNHISDMIDDEVHDEVVAKLVESWNNVASHSLAAHYQRLSKQSRYSAIDGKVLLLPFDNYHFFMKSIFAGILNLWAAPNENMMRFYLNFTEAWFSAVECRAYRRNVFFNYDLLIRELISYQKTVDEEKHQWLEERIQAVKVMRNQAQEGCLTHVKGLIEMWLVDLEKKFAPEELGAALVNILKKRSRISNNFALNKELSEIYRFNIDPHGRNAGFIKFIFTAEKREEMGEQEILRIISEAIEFTIIAYATDHKINIYEVVFPLPTSLQCLNLPEEELVQKLLDKECSEPHQLYALYQTTASPLIRTMIEEIVSSRSTSLYSGVISPLVLSMLTGRSRISTPLFPNYSLLPQIFPAEHFLRSNVDEESVPQIPSSALLSSSSSASSSSSSIVSDSFVPPAEWLPDDMISEEERRMRFVGLPTMRFGGAFPVLTSPLFTPGYNRLNSLIRGQTETRLAEDDPDGSKLARQLDVVLDLRRGEETSEEELDRERVQGNGCCLM